MDGISREHDGRAENKRLTEEQAEQQLYQERAQMKKGMPLGPQAFQAGQDMAAGQGSDHSSLSRRVEHRIADMTDTLHRLHRVSRFLRNPSPSGAQIAEGMEDLRVLGYTY